MWFISPAVLLVIMFLFPQSFTFFCLYFMPLKAVGTACPGSVAGAKVRFSQQEALAWDQRMGRERSWVGYWFPTPHSTWLCFWHGYSPLLSATIYDEGTSPMVTAGAVTALPSSGSFGPKCLSSFPLFFVPRHFTIFVDFSYTAYHLVKMVLIVNIPYLYYLSMSSRFCWISDWYSNVKEMQANIWLILKLLLIV